ncbi:hypothetical protein KJ786_01585 [Patescibacteria group bacterium]|nr:hypothetical protein [Patescibacteria group bacterium]
MKFIVKNTNETIVNMAKKIGYKIGRKSENGEESLVKDLSRGYGYPRFHVFIKKDEDHNEFIFNLHLDQKFASYENSGAHSHSGEYDGEIIENEAERIKKVLANTNIETPSEGNIYRF